MRLSLILVVLFLTACNGSSPVRQDEPAQQSMSQQMASSESQRRAKAHTELGVLYLQQGRHAIALEEAKIALSADSSYAPAYDLLGLTHLDLHENAIAAENFQRALSLAPGDPDINQNYGWFLCQTGKEQESIAYFQRAVKNPLYTTPAKSFLSAGICSIRLKDDKAAEGFFNMVLRYDGTNAQANYWLADIRYRQNRYAEAKQRIDEVHRAMEPNPETLWLAIRIDRKAGDRESEARNMSQLRRKFPSSTEYQRLMQGQFE